MPKTIPTLNKTAKLSVLNPRGKRLLFCKQPKPLKPNYLECLWWHSHSRWHVPESLNRWSAISSHSQRFVDSSLSSVLLLPPSFPSDTFSLTHTENSTKPSHPKVVLPLPPYRSTVSAKVAQKARPQDSHTRNPGPSCPDWAPLAKPSHFPHNHTPLRMPRVPIIGTLQIANQKA